MKQLKMLGLAGMAAMALMALAGVSSASATVLCKNTTTPCPEHWATGTKFAAELAPEREFMEWQNAMGVVVDQCTESTLAGETANTGGSTSKVTVNLSSVTWSGCAKTKKEVLKTGSFEIDYQPETEPKLAQVKFSGLEWREGSCTYRAVPEAQSAGIFPSSSPGSDAILDMEWRMPRVSGLFCSPEMIWISEYAITAPTPLFFTTS